MTIGNARIVGDQVKCWNCTCKLGEIVRAVGGGYGFGAASVYRWAEGDPIPGLSVLVIPPHTQDRIRRTGMPLSSRTKPKLDKDGGMRVMRPRAFPMPVLLTCWRPSCGEPNRIDTQLAQGA